ncbi:hypothetical protein FA15DRAFT_663567 [Coprinopsis marcescibilis]|uniref:Uncharacterized protein n=1 Tax=Coprinopsis marcescibilis TaxID=230819 RepID=A0A5C3LC22_COPMA|nr:hypothetical protein FA15DRAFT_663567 [Coprinopsis marcescibilis]
MLLRFTSPDMLNTSLVDVSTGERAYDITTELLPQSSESSPTTSVPFSGTDSVLLSPSEDFASTSSNVWRQPEPVESFENADLRRTQISDASGNVLVDVSWKGRRPDITICDEKIGGLADLFGSSAVRFMPKVLAIPTRFDTEYVWQATADSLFLFDYDTDSMKGSLHQNCIRIPGPLKSSKSKQSAPPTPALKRKPSKLHIFSSKSDAHLSATNDCEFVSSPSSPSPKSTFLPAHLPGLGSNYLEFESHPLALDVEIILSFLMMEILRRGRFSLTPYTFEKPTTWQFKEARESFFRRLRRNTV